MQLWAADGDNQQRALSQSALAPGPLRTTVSASPSDGTATTLTSRWIPSVIALARATPGKISLAALETSRVRRRAAMRSATSPAWRGRRLRSAAIIAPSNSLTDAGTPLTRRETCGGGFRRILQKTSCR